MFELIPHLATLLLEFQIPPAISRWTPFLFSFLGRGICEWDDITVDIFKLMGLSVYIFVGSIILHSGVTLIAAGSVIMIVGAAYVVLEFVPSIEPPQNMRDASGEWGAEQI